MSSAEVVIAQQESLMSLICKAAVNYKKCPKSRLTQGYLRARLSIVDEYWRSFHAGHQDLFKITNKDERAHLVYFSENKYDECEEVYLELKADISDYLESLIANASTSNRHPPSGKNIEVKLPKINLPSYSGAYEEWQSFEDTFNSLINNNKHLSDVEKLHYLKSCVTGEASNTIKHFQITEKNYKPAWDTLKNRYSQKRLIVNAILKRMFALKKMTSQSSLQLKTLLDSTKECLNSLKSLGVIVDSWDPLVNFLVVQKLDQDSHKEWENHVSTKNSSILPTFEQLCTFVENRICTLELTSSTIQTKGGPKERSSHVAVATASTSTSMTTPTCKVCDQEHFLYHCKEFGRWDPEKRSEFAKENRLCYNCLSIGHSVFYCKQRGTCKICGRKHHSLLHSYKGKEQPTTSEKPSSFTVNTEEEGGEEENITEDEREDVIASHLSTSSYQRALLATALVPLKDSLGQIVFLRALVDQGSQATFVSERAAQLMKLKKTPIRGTVTGVGCTKTSVSHVVHLEVLSRYEESFKLLVKAYVLPTQLTTKLPCKEIKPTNWTHLEGIKLADPKYYMPGKIDLLLGIDVYTEILKNNLIKGPPGTPCAQETSLGWILFGKINDSHPEEDTIVMHHRLDLDIHDMLKNMWEIEPTHTRKFTAEEKLCEDLYATTHSRTSDGRYRVKIPFKSTDTMQKVGETRVIAKKRFDQLERKLDRNPKLKEEYVKVIDEYIELKHAEEVPEEEVNATAIYLPHHAVLRQDKETTKVRVVFDGSCKGSNNKSLNDEQLIGPQLQEDLRSLIMRWRMKPICFVADLQKMYRQILVTREDADCQRILWRKDKSETLKEYRLLRVTFGTSSAPYLAVRTLMQLADDEGTAKGLLKTAQTIKEDFYVDDCMSGCSTVQEALQLSRQLTEIMRRGGFTLQKWASNSPEFMNEIDPSLRCANANKHIKDERVIKTLGLTWNISSDSFQYCSNLFGESTTTTKRSILADVQRLFDPLGWLGPATIMTKMLIQQLWVDGCNWDDEVRDDLKKEWSRLRQSFNDLNKIKINRWLKIGDKTTDISLHGYCDASNKGYCAVVYCRLLSADDKIETSLVASKTRVAPLRSVTIPRLELLGALLLARLLTFVREAMRIPKNKTYAWTDSSVVLSWINGDPNRWKTFVSNRVIEILENIDSTQWFHVASEENPADLGSRGMILAQLVDCKLWWSGPEWLAYKDIRFRNRNFATTELEMKKSIQVNLKINEIEETPIKFEEFNSLSELLRVIVYAKRFLNRKGNSHNIEKLITTEELDDALQICVKISQRQEFLEEIEGLKKRGKVKKVSKLRTLNPYLDKHGVLRVGGRLNNSSLDESMKHPVILGTQTGFTSLIIIDAHKRTLHGGTQLVLCYLRPKYWIIHAKNSVKRHIHKCLICAKIKASNKAQIMGHLPTVRTKPARPFLHSGVDFAGPFMVITTKGRGAKTVKAYISVFICMVTKAIHLELVGDLTSESFIGAFHRFVARRGRCAHIWSDQGRNFVGANKELVAAWKEANLQLPGDLAQRLSSDGTQWHFIPPYSPNFGGLWEAGVKSVKYHLKRILTSSLTFEEMATVLCQIEACLNSRPLSPIDTTDTDVIEPLTPGHFLIGEAPINIPSPNLTDINIGRLSRWQLVQRLVRDFWRRWQAEYLTRLQERPKWMTRKNEFEVGDIVLIKDDQLPPGKWSLGRIVQKHTGPDGLSRVYSLKSRGDVVVRSISKLCALPIDKS